MLVIYCWDKLEKEERQKLLERPAVSNVPNFQEKVRDIIDQVIRCGDDAIMALTARYDQVLLKNLAVTHDEFAAAHRQIKPDALSAIEFAKKQIETYHRSLMPAGQKIKTCEGVTCERQARPISRVGLYIPGGSAPLVSTVLMLAVPAKIANCPLRIICTPPNKEGKIDPHILVAAELCGITQVYKTGGAQAIAGMAYGTETIPKVDKIFGPGNAWVTEAKIAVSQDPRGAGIDMPAGPSELLVIADDEANPAFAAADLLSQAEHGPDSQVILITTSEEFALEVKSEIKHQLAQLPRRAIAEKSLLCARLLVVNNVDQAIAISNSYAPEHLILQVANPQQYMPAIQNAGAVFLGNWAPETAGDYVTGSNHVLPTSGYARYCSGLSAMDFIKFINFQMVTADGLQTIGKYAEQLAQIEGLQAHQRAVSLRLAELKTKVNINE